MHYRLLPVILFIIAAISCESDKPDTSFSGVAVVSDELYNNTVSDIFMISDAHIEGDTLLVRFSASCCSGKSWKVKLVSAGSIIKTLPPQRYARLILENPELCEALCTRTAAFNLKPARVTGGELKINLQGWNQQLSYYY